MRPTEQTILRPTRMFRAPVARGLGAKAHITTNGGQYSAGLIRRAAVITRGEAQGHDMWIDRHMLTQVERAINAHPVGAKGRFTHPGLSGDGLGKALGRWRDAGLEGDVVRADLHLYESAHDTPDGDLADYVLRLAKEDPAAFGASIAFDPDLDQEERFIAEHADETGRFSSPDPENYGNRPHARLAALEAVDVVDTPAANPAGLFHRGDQVAMQADELLRYALGLTDLVPEQVSFGVAPQRVRAFVQRFLQDHRLILTARPGWQTSARAREIQFDKELNLR